jgi:2'-5' RNA ligase
MKASLFPPAPPASLTDAGEIIRNDWAAFSGLDTLTNHWERPAWPDGAQAYYWLLSLGGHPELRARAEACQSFLSDVPDIDPIPAALLHLTLCRVGSAANLRDDLLSKIADAAAQRVGLFGPLRLSIGPLAGSAGAIRFSVTPWDALLALQGELVSARNSILGGTPNTGLRPHVSIAYNARQRPAAPVVECVRELRGQSPVEVIMTEVELVRLVRDGRIYHWATLQRLPLTGTRPSL